MAELGASGTAAVIAPYPHHKDRQQHLNAEALVRAGAAMICEDATTTSLNVAALRSSLVPILRDPARLEAMCAAAADLGRDSAAGEVAAWLARAGR